METALNKLGKRRLVMRSYSRKANMQLGLVVFSADVESRSDFWQRPNSIMLLPAPPSPENNPA